MAQGDRSPLSEEAPDRQSRSAGQRPLQAPPARRPARSGSGDARRRRTRYEARPAVPRSGMLIMDIQRDERLGDLRVAGSYPFKSFDQFFVSMGAKLPIGDRSANNRSAPLLPSHPCKVCKLPDSRESVLLFFDDRGSWQRRPAGGRCRHYWSEPLRLDHKKPAKPNFRPIAAAADGRKFGVFRNSIPYLLIV